MCTPFDDNSNKNIYRVIYEQFEKNMKERDQTIARLQKEAENLHSLIDYYQQAKDRYTGLDADDERSPIPPELRDKKEHESNTISSERYAKIIREQEAELAKLRFIADKTLPIVRDEYMESIASQAVKSARDSVNLSNSCSDNIDHGKPTNPKDAVGIKKPPSSTLPQNVMAEVGVAMLEGALKYGRHNYRVIGVRASVYYDATRRHIDSWWEGEDIDQDSMLSHLSKAIASLVVLRDAMMHGMLNNDRPPKSDVAGNRERLTRIVTELIDRYPAPKEAFVELAVGIDEV